MEKLRELHEKIKQHPFRISSSEELWPEYRAILREFSHQIWECLCPMGKDQRRDSTHKYYGATNIIHDFNAAISNRDMKHVERCIQCVHQFLDTGKFSEYYSYGYQHALVRFVFDEEDNEYHGIYSEAELNRRIEELEAKKAKAYAESEERGKEWERWDGNALAYWKKAKFYHDSHKE